MADLCMLVNKQVMSHLKDVFLSDHPVEQSMISRHIVVIQRHMEILGRLNWFGPRRDLTIGIKKLIILFDNEGISYCKMGNLNWAYSQMIGPTGLIKIMEAIFYSVLENFEAIFTTPEDFLKIHRCRQQTKIALRSMNTIFSRVPDKFDYLIRKTTNLEFIEMDLKIRYN
jgi:hypothetical protein